MDKKYTSLENQIRNVVRGASSTGESKSLESKIRDVVLNEGSEKFAKIVARTAAARGEPITTDLVALKKKHEQIQATATAAAQHAAQAQKDYEDLVKKYGGQVEEEVEVDEALGTGGNEGGEYKGTPPAFFKSFHVEPKVGDTHPAAKSGAAISRDRAKIATSETMKKESYIITPRGRSAIEEGLWSLLFKGGAKLEPEVAAAAKAAGKLAPEAEAAAAKGSKLGKAARIAANLGVDAAILNALYPGQNVGGGVGGAGAPSNISATGIEDTINLPRNRHYSKDRIVYKPEIHYNEYEPDGSYIGEDSAEQTDAERSAIENVARPNSKNKLTKQAEIQRKILENTARRKSVILKAKEENKSGKDGANGMVETKPELKRADINEIAGASAAGAATKGLVGRAIPGLGLALAADDAYDRVKKGDYVGAGISGLSGITGLFPGFGTAASLGLAGANLARDYKRGEFNDTQDAGASTTPETSPDSVGTTAAPAASLGSAMGTAAGRAITQSSKPGSAMGTAAGRAITQSSKPGSVGGSAASKATTKTPPTAKPSAKPATIATIPSRPAKSVAGSDYEQKRAELLRANPNSVGARSSLPPEARGEAPLPAAPAKPQVSPEINRTNTEAPRTMGSSWNNSYKNKYSMGPGPSQFPSK